MHTTFPSHFLSQSRSPGHSSSPRGREERSQHLLTRNSRERSSWWSDFCRWAVFLGHVSRFICPASRLLGVRAVFSGLLPHVTNWPSGNGLLTRWWEYYFRGLFSQCREQLRFPVPGFALYFEKGLSIYITNQGDSSLQGPYHLLLFTWNGESYGNGGLGGPYCCLKAAPFHV